MAFRITAGSRDARQPLESLTAPLRGKVLADQGYLSKALLLRLWQRGLHILSCLAATTLAQPKVNIGNFAIPNPMPTTIPRTP